MESFKKKPIYIEKSKNNITLFKQTYGQVHVYLFLNFFFIKKNCLFQNSDLANFKYLPFYYHLHMYTSILQHYKNTHVKN